MPKTLPPRKSAASLNIAIVAGLLVTLAPFVQARQQPDTAPPASVPGPPRPAPVLFHDAGCEQCHGANLAGTAKGPSLLSVGKVLKKDQIRSQIHDGGGEMPSFADALQGDEIDRLVDFLAKKKKAPRGLPGTPTAKPPSAVPPPPPPPSASGSSDQ